MVDAIALSNKNKVPIWLTLREELSLFQGPRAADGSPTWTLYDPAVHRYFRIGWLEFECLHRWDLSNSIQIAEAIQKETPIAAEVSDVEQFIEFLSKNSLTRPLGQEATKRFTVMRHAAKPGFWLWLLHNYLFFRVPLIQPDRYLKKMRHLMRIFFTGRALYILGIAACFAVFLVMQQWSQFSHSFMYTLTPEGLLATVGMMSLSKVVHELGHAFAANHFGCRVPAMGVALLLGMPVLWTDVTDAWRLPKRQDRLVIDAAGMIAELTLAIIATFLWSVLPDGPLRSGSYLLASTAWLITLAINLNPFMRFDGYYLLADTLDVPNLQDRSFALAKWQLRESLFGFDIEPPEHWFSFRRRFLIIYAYSVWIYRLILFTGIAWAVYYFFFKALGLFLFSVEIGWFIIRPIWGEVIVWKNLITLHHEPIRPRLSWLVPILLIAALFIPWQSYLLVPGLLRADSEFTFYCVEPAKVQEVLVKEGDVVTTNQILLTLASPDLDYKIIAAKLKYKELSERLASQSLESNLARNNPKDYEELQSTQAELAGFRAIKDKLTVRATFDGRIRDLSDSLRQGEWLAKDEPIGSVEGTADTVIGYVEEADLSKLKVEGDGLFYPEGGDFSPLDVTVSTIDATGTRELKVEELASTYGGELAVRPDSEKQLIPDQGIYRVAAKVNMDGFQQQSTIRGRLALSTKPASVISRLFRLATITLVKESGW